MKNKETGLKTILIVLLCSNVTMLQAGERGSSVLPESVGHPTFASPHVRPIAIAGDRVFVTNTPADTLDVIDRNRHRIVARIPVGIDPVSVAIRPDQKEIWVSNHVSDSISVIDIDSSSATCLSVVATIQQFDRPSRSTRFDEPVGIAFASNDKAYVALSSENTIAVVDVESRTVTNRLPIHAQDPRAIAVHGERLYVIPFESNNKTQLSGGTPPLDGNLVTFDAWQHSIAHNNVLSLGHVVDIIKHPRVPDRDLFVFDTQTDELIETVDTLGTLLYGMAIDSDGNVFVAQTDARNDVNGRAGTKKHGVAELENRAFLNRVTRIDRHLAADEVRFFDLEPLPPQQPSPGAAAATPHAIEISADDQTLFVTTAGSDQLLTLDAATGETLGRVDVQSVPRGIAITSGDDGRAEQAWVFNAVEDSVSVVDVSDVTHPTIVQQIALDDPTDPLIKRGRKAFESAAASTTGTFSCASCHPNGHTDQLLWVLKTPTVSGGDQIMPRSTMPVRGLRDTEPFHWDGIPGDPYGGNNSANIYTQVPPNSDRNTPLASIRHLIDGGILGTMSMDADETINDEGKSGAMTAQDRDAMSAFLVNLPYPPAQRRSYSNVVSDRAVDGFKLFHIDGDHDEKPQPNVCGNCHRMPFLVSTNTPGTGMDAPTWRGAYDRFLILPQGRLNIIDFDFYARMADVGQPEKSIWQMSWGGRPRFDPVWEMVLEGSTGFSGAFARQWTLNQQTADLEMTTDLLSALEQSASEHSIVLAVDGVELSDNDSQPISLRYDPSTNDGCYIDLANAQATYRRMELTEAAAMGKFVGTWTARYGAHGATEFPQPALWTLGPIESQRGRQAFPIVHAGNPTMTLSGRHIDDAASVTVDGRVVPAMIEIDGERIEIELETLPSVGMHLLQVQNTSGMFSNDFIFHVATDAVNAVTLQSQLDEPHVNLQGLLADAIRRGDIARVKRLTARGAKIDARHSDSGSTPLSQSALHNQLAIAKFLIEQGSNVNATDRDGNTPLHVAAFLCHAEIVELLLEHGASPDVKSERGERPIDTVSGPWNDQLAGVYRFIGGLISKELDLARMEQDRPKIVAILSQQNASRE